MSRSRVSTQYPYREYHRSTFNQSHELSRCGDWQMSHLGFSTDIATTRTPFVFFGGVFQDFNSFRPFAKALAALHPVIILDLPGQGANRQRATELSFDDLAGLVVTWMDRYGFERIIPVGMSHGAVIAHSFATLHPQRTERLIISGASRVPSETLLRLRDEALSCVARGNRDGLAASMVQHFYNLSARDSTGITDAMIANSYDIMRMMDDESLARHCDNAARLFAADLSRVPQCPTLFLAGEWDHCIRPHETLALAARCPNSQFGLIYDADHMVALERPEVMNRIFAAFASGAPLAGIGGVHWLDPRLDTLCNRRSSARVATFGQAVRISDGNGFSETSTLVDLSTDGCLIVGQGRLAAAPRVRIELGDGVEVTALRLAEDHGIRYVFFKDSMGATVALRGAMERALRMGA